MKRITTLCLVLVACLGVAVSSRAVAQEVAQQAESTVLDNLVSRCDDIQGSLRRLHTADALLRVNVGQTYNSISVRLMARLNSRLALNRIDSTELVEVAADFDRQRLDFGARYSEYETSLAALVKIDCRTKPAEFYAKLLTTRDLRLELGATVKGLNSNISDYRTAVERLQTELAGGADEGSN